MGLELARLFDWRLLLAFAMFLQFFVNIFLGGQHVFVPTEFAFTVSILLFLGSIVLLAALRLTQGKPSMITVEWRDSRDTLGTLQVSYTNSRGRKRTGLVVERVNPRPTEPLFKAGWSRYQPVVPVEGTSSSLLIDFRNVKKYSLGLGFRTSDEMNKVYDQLR